MAFDNKIIVLLNKEGFPQDDGYLLDYQTNIQQIKLSYHEKLLAVALAPCSDQLPKIIM